MNKVKSDDQDFSILSILLKSPPEMAERATSLQGSIIDDLEDNSHPRLQLLETISEMLEPDLKKSGQLYQHALHQMKLSELRSLFEASEKINSRTKLISNIKQIRKVSSELSFELHLSTTQTVENLSWSETAYIDLRVEIDDFKKEVISKLDRRPTLDEALTVIDEFGLNTIPITINKAELARNTLIINDIYIVEFVADSIQSRLVGLFFSGKEALKKRAFQFGDIFDKLEPPTYSTLSKDERTALKKRYYDARSNINTKIKSQTGLNADFILYKDNHFYINQDLLE